MTNSRFQQRRSRRRLWFVAGLVCWAATQNAGHHKLQASKILQNDDRSISMLSGSAFRGSPSEEGLSREGGESLYGGLGPTFEVNSGQVDAEVKYLARASGFHLFLTRSEAVLRLRNSSEDVVRMKFVGANRNPRIQGKDPLPGRSHYFVGRDRQGWVGDVAHYTAVQYQEIYPGIAPRCNTRRSILASIWSFTPTSVNWNTILSWHPARAWNRFV